MRELYALCEPYCKRKVRRVRNDFPKSNAHNARMVRKKLRKPIWYAAEWIQAKGLKQADIVTRTEGSLNKGQVSDYINGRRRWNEDVLVKFAYAIGIEPADLLRPPYAVENELASYVMRLDERARKRALGVLKAMEAA